MMELLDQKIINQLEQLSVVARRLAHSSYSGANLSHRRGYSPEFSDYKEYSAGDDPRFIDWNVYGRLGRLYTKLFLAEDELHVRIILDTSQSMNEKFTTALELCAALGYVALAAGNRVQICCGKQRNAASPVFKNRSSIHRLFTFLSSLKTGGDCQPLELVEATLAGRTVGTGIKIMISDFYSGSDGGHEKTLLEIIRKLAAGRQEFHLIHLLSSCEIAPPTTGKKIFVDSENGEKLKVDCRQCAEGYAQVFSEFTQLLRRECTAHNGGYSLVNSDDHIAEIITRLCRDTILRH